MSTCGALRVVYTRLRRVWRATYRLHFFLCIYETCLTLFVTKCHAQHLTSVHFGFGVHLSAIQVRLWVIELNSEDGIVAYLCDHEPALGLLSGRWPSSDWISGYDIAADADLLIHTSAQYTDEEYARCVGWGHSTYQRAFEFATRVGAKRLVPFHHDPSHDDETLDRLLDHAVAAFKSPCVATPGLEGATFELGR